MPNARLWAIEFQNDRIGSFDPVVIEALSGIYEQRWIEIQGTEYDYRRLQSGINAGWIRLAQLIVRDHLKTDYQTFLTPYLPALSLAELNQYRVEHGHVYFKILDKTYPAFPGSLKRSIVSPFQPCWEIPRHLLPNLLEWVDVYFEYSRKGDDLTYFRQCLLSWSNDLQSIPIDDVYYLYSRTILVNEKTIYFIDVFLDCLYGDFSACRTGMLNLARWLCIRFEPIQRYAC